MDSFKWDNDDGNNVSCFVSSSNHSTLGSLELEPAVIYASPLGIVQSKDMTLFRQQWEATVTRTLEDATEANTSSILKYYSAVEAEFTEFSNVYMLMQCKPDITSQEARYVWKSV
ncbi:hypothetical protein Bca52824_001764 [Brassica carinata]|uniref:Uncharacterized protein n=1 Tax=Brassica carinata TaxID=52824 RepID=A0A8X7WGW3_BRACI|nr:hypothetical protein Bca52824_001764 [Brassica carinata]